MGTRGRLALTAAALLFAGSARAWSPKGHRIVARIAQSRLSPAALAAAGKILGKGITLENVAPCADFVRGDRGAKCAGIALEPSPESRHWHYIDVPIDASPRGPGDLFAYCAGGDCVVEQLRAEAAALRDPAASPAEKRRALIFLVHFMGDLHQPLHCATELDGGVDDRGGNGKVVTWDAGTAASSEEGPAAPRGRAPLNLHALWDRVILPNDDADPAALSRRLVEELRGRDTADWTDGDFITAAALESFQVAKTAIYPAYHRPGGATIDAAYRTAMEKVAFERLQKAGVRLAALLEQSLREPPSAIAADRLKVRLNEASKPAW